jgi:tetratricopeptide (TPR) repeat protein
MRPGFRALVIRMLSAWHGLNQKQIALRSGMTWKNLSQLLRRQIHDEDYEKLLAATRCKLAEVQVVAGCVEGLEAVARERELTPGEQEEVERTVREASGWVRQLLSETALLSRPLPPEGAPGAPTLDAERRQAGLQWLFLAPRTAKQRSAVVRLVREYQTPALLERVRAEAEARTTGDPEEAASLQRLAQEIAERIDPGLRPTPSASAAAVRVEAAAFIAGGRGGGGATSVRVEAAARVAGGRGGGATSARVEAAALIPGGRGGGGATTAGVEAAARVGPIPGGGEEGPELAGGRPQERGGEDEGDENQAHRGISHAAPAAGLRGPRGPRLRGMVRQAGAKNPAPRGVDRRMKPENLLARLARALSGQSQEQFGELTGVAPKMISAYEMGLRTPSSTTLGLLTLGAGLTIREADEVLLLAGTLARPRRRAEPPADALAGDLAALAARFSQRLLRQSPPEDAPRAEDRRRAEELWLQLAALSEDEQWAVVTAGQDFQNWALAERVSDESEIQASRDVERAASLARIAERIADLVPGPEEWRNRVRGYAAAHGPNVLRVAGRLRDARADLKQAKQLWAAGADPQGLLDPGRLLDLEASLCRAERRFDKALALLDQALPVSHHPGRILVKKGFTLEVLGEYQLAVEALLQAEPLIDRAADARLWYKLRANLAVNYTHVGRPAEAFTLVRQARPVAEELGDKLDLLRLTWLEGRIAAGEGRLPEAIHLLEQAQREFATREMWYDVALAQLELAALLLAGGQSSRVREMAAGLVTVFESHGIHREALAALRLFQEAAQREEATADLAGRILRYLFRARYDERLVFSGE